MTDLFGPKRTDSVEPEPKHQAVLLSDSHVEGVVLGSDRAAIPTVPHGHGGTN